MLLNFNWQIRLRQMNSLLFFIIGIPIIEIYLFIKIGAKIGAITTILLIISTAFIGVIYVRYEGFNTLKSGLSQLVKNQIPVYEIISGATLAFAALLLILPGFATDIIGILLIIPFTRKVMLSKFINKNKKKYESENNKNYIDGDYEDISDDNDKKLWNNFAVHTRSFSW